MKALAELCHELSYSEMKTSIVQNIFPITVRNSHVILCEWPMTWFSTSLGCFNVSCKHTLTLIKLKLNHMWMTCLCDYRLHIDCVRKTVVYCISFKQYVEEYALLNILNSYIVVKWPHIVWMRIYNKKYMFKITVYICYHTELSMLHCGIHYPAQCVPFYTAHLANIVDHQGISHRNLHTVHNIVYTAHYRVFFKT